MICLAIALIFILFKLIGLITWSWWFVLIPFYIGVVFSYGVFAQAEWAAFKEYFKKDKNNKVE